MGSVSFDSGIHYVGYDSGIRSALGFICAGGTGPSGVVEMAAMGSREDGYLYDVFDFGDGKPLRRASLLRRGGGTWLSLVFTPNSKI